MSSRSNNGSCSQSGNCNQRLANHISRFIGETVTIFTTSGGASGCGFTGVVLSVNQCFVRLVTEQGMAPSNPLSESICGNNFNNNGFNNGINNNNDFAGVRGCSIGNNGRGGRDNCWRQTGSVCDIPIDSIAAFCHNAV